MFKKFWIVIDFGWDGIWVSWDNLVVFGSYENV